MKKRVKMDDLEELRYNLRLNQALDKGWMDKFLQVTPIFGRERTVDTSCKPIDWKKHISILDLVDGDFQ